MPSAAKKEIPEGMEEIREKSPIPWYGLGAVWLLWALVLPFYRISDYLLCAAVSIGVYLVLAKLCPGQTRLVPKKQEPTGSPDADRVLAEGQSFLQQLAGLNSKIKSPALSTKLDRLTQLTGRILAYVRQKPQAAAGLRRFLDYYLPTTLKLLDSYQRAESSGISEQHTRSTIEGVEGIMDTILLAFEKQLDHLFAEEALDISTDITVLEGMLQQEGLTGSPFEQKQNPPFMPFGG